MRGGSPPSSRRTRQGAKETRAMDGEMGPGFNAVAVSKATEWASHKDRALRSAEVADSGFDAEWECTPPRDDPSASHWAEIPRIPEAVAFAEVLLAFRDGSEERVRFEGRRGDGSDLAFVRSSFRTDG